MVLHGLDSWKWQRFKAVGYDLNVHTYLKSYTGHSKCSQATMRIGWSTPFLGWISLMSRMPRREREFFSRSGSFKGLDKKTIECSHSQVVPSKQGPVCAMADWYRSSSPNRVAGGVEVPQSHRSATGQGRGDISSLPQDQIPFYHNGHNMVGKWVMWLTRQN